MRKPGGRRFNVGRLATATDPGTLRDAFAEFLATAIFVFAAEGATLSLGYSASCHECKGVANGLVAVALAHALALAAAVASTINVSGGHVNPAITFGALLGGHVCLVRSVVYWTAQLLGAVAAALLLRVTTGGVVHLPEPELAAGMKGWHAVVLEAAMAFGLTYAYYATAIDPRRGAGAHAGMVAPLAVGLLAGANVMACGPFDGAVMNPARALGPAFVGTRRWHNQWVYWAGPLAGAGLAGLFYEHVVLNPNNGVPPPNCT